MLSLSNVERRRRPRVDHRHQLAAIDGALRYVLRHDNLRMGIDGGLSIIGLHEPVFRFHYPAFGISEILLGVGGRLRRWWRGGLARLLATLGLSLLLGFS